MLGIDYGIIHNYMTYLDCLKKHAIQAIL